MWIDILEWYITDEKYGAEFSNTEHEIRIYQSLSI